MGVSTDAILVYGIPLKEESLKEELSFDTSNENVSKDHPNKLFSADVDGLTIVLHCCDSCVMGILAVAETEYNASRGNPEKINVNKLYHLQTHFHNEKLKAYCEKYKLETEGEPGWWLVSWWG